MPGWVIKDTGRQTGGTLVAPGNTEYAEQYWEHMILPVPDHSCGFSPGRSVNLSVCTPSDNSLRNKTKVWMCFLVQ